MTRHYVSRRRFRGHVEPAVWPGIVICFACTGYGLGMLGQPQRFYATPAYGILTEMLDIRIWGAMYLVIGALFAVFTIMVTNRLFGIIAHIPAAIVTSFWLFVFIIRWLTDPSTTDINPVNWGMLLIIILRSASLLPSANRPATGSPPGAS